MKLNIITVSTRPTRIGPKIASWAGEFARAHAHGFEIVETDLAQVNLPLFDEPEHPAKQDYAHAHTKAWSKIVADSDAFVFVLPEYNFFAPPSFVNAVTYLVKEWAYKPASFVSYGGVSGGLRSVQTAKLLLTSMRVVPIYEQVVMPNVFAQLGEDGFKANAQQEQSAEAMIAELARVAEAMAPLR